MMRVLGAGAIISIAIILMLSINISCGTTGYNIHSSVDGISWSIDRHIRNLSYNAEETVYGAGNFSRYNNIRETSDLAYTEKTSSARGGNVSLNEVSSFKSREGPVAVNYYLQSIAYIDNQYLNNSDKSNIYIVENWPYYFLNQRKLTYNGNSIKTFEKYDSSGDIITTYSDSWMLKKESMFYSMNNKTRIFVNLTPQGIIKERVSNKNLSFLLDVQSVGNKESLEVINTVPSDERSSKIEDAPIHIVQDYAGQINMKLKIRAKDAIPLDLENESYNYSTDYLPCCQNGYLLIEPQMPSI
jgi:hypothetical protein